MPPSRTTWTARGKLRRSRMHPPDMASSPPLVNATARRNCLSLWHGPFIASTAESCSIRPKRTSLMLKPRAPPPRTSWVRMLLKGPIRPDLTGSTPANRSKRAHQPETVQVTSLSQCLACRQLAMGQRGKALHLRSESMCRLFILTASGHQHFTNSHVMVCRMSCRLKHAQMVADMQSAL